jgi:hypothetical protein
MGSMPGRVQYSDPLGAGIGPPHPMHLTRPAPDLKNLCEVMSTPILEFLRSNVNQYLYYMLTYKHEMCIDSL